MKNLLTYSFGYYPLEQKTSWDKLLNWLDKKTPNQITLVLNTIASTMLEQIQKYCIPRVQVSHKIYDRLFRGTPHTVWLYKPHRQ